MMKNFFSRHTQPQNTYEQGYNDGRYGGWMNPPVSFFGLVDDQYMKGFYRGKNRRYHTGI